METQLSLSIILSATAVVVFLYWYLTSPYSYWEKRGIPFVNPFPIFGNVIDYIFLRNTSTESYMKIYKTLEGHQFGGFYSGSTPNLILRDPVIIKQIVVKDFNHFLDRNPSFVEKITPLARNLASLTGSRWRKLRVKLTPSFTSGKMRMMLPTIIGCSQELVSFLGESADDSNNIEIRNVASNFTTDVIGSCGFGLEINSMKSPDSEFCRMGNKVFQPTFLTGALRSLGLIYRPILKLVRHPIASKDVNDLFLGIVKETMSYRQKNKVVRNDFLKLLIQLKNKGKVDEDLMSSKDDHHLTNNETVSSSNEGEDEPLDMTDTLLAAQCFVFFLAGFETSSTTISCCLHELAVNPDIQERLRKEVDNVLIKHGGQITYEALQDLKYMDAVVDGLRFGLMQVKVGLTALLSKYKFSVCETTSIPVTFNPISFITLRPRDIHLKISHRDF